MRRKFFEAVDAPVALRDEVLRAIRRMYRYERFGRTHPTGGDAPVLSGPRNGEPQNREPQEGVDVPGGEGTC